MQRSSTTGAPYSEEIAIHALEALCPNASLPELRERVPTWLVDEVQQRVGSIANAASRAKGSSDLPGVAPRRQGNEDRELESIWYPSKLAPLSSSEGADS